MARAKIACTLALCLALPFGGYGWQSQKAASSDRRNQALGLVVMVQTFYEEIVKANGELPDPFPDPDLDGAGIIVGADKAKNLVYVLTASHVIHRDFDKLPKRVYVTLHNPQNDRDDKKFRSEAKVVAGCGQLQSRPRSPAAAQLPSAGRALDDWWILTVPLNADTDVLAANNERLRPRSIGVADPNSKDRPPAFFGPVSVIGLDYNHPWGEAVGEVEKLSGWTLDLTVAAPEGFSGGPVFDDDWRLVGMFQGGDASTGKGLQHAVAVSELPLDWAGAPKSEGTTMEACKGVGTLKETSETAAGDVATDYEKRWAQAYNNNDVSLLLKLFPTLPNAERLSENFKRNSGKTEMTAITPGCNPSKRTSSSDAEVECTATRRFEPRPGVRDTSRGCVCLQDHFWLVKQSDAWRIARWEGTLCPSGSGATPVKK
jgi:Trypsin-like peptidase domain